MRRSDKEIIDLASMESIIQRAEVCHLALCKNNEPYIVPCCFGYEDNTVYVHGARDGTKLDMIKANNRVCVEFETDVNLIQAEVGCKWGMSYRSVIGFGHAFIVDDIGSKHKACDLIMRHYADGKYEYSDQALDSIIVIRIELNRITGKKSGF
ncbi:MAG: pyridoxamine 5'-phosphate oxidase family protein [Armatimonadetes bacterium]|nr:pyridoxamine 5'-phosphate oxidase family protein [Armatimonadota bacterium]